MPQLAQAQVRIILPQQQPILRARREHPIRLRRALRNQVINQHPDVSLVPPQHHRRLPRRAPRRIDARHQPLRARLLVARRAVDLPREEQVPAHLRLQAGVKLRGVREIILHRVGRAHDFRPLAPNDRPHQVHLHLERQARREPVHVNLIRRDALRLEENLMPLLLRELHDLILNARAIPRTHPFDDARIHRRLVQVRADDRRRGVRRVGEVAGQLPADLFKD